MTDLSTDRRGLFAGALGLAAASAGAASAAPQPAYPQAPPLKLSPRPMSFDPKAVTGLSERILTSHYTNNYVGAVNRLNAIATEFAGLDPSAAPNYRINGLKREEMVAWNSMALHEIYFDGFGPAERPSAALAQAIERDFGSHDRWAAEFSSMGKSLSGGWILLTWSRRNGRLVNAWAADHSMTLADGAPLLALDMYEHAYHMDYGQRPAAYVDAFMKAFTWRGANQAFARAIA